ncbi:hypothetical protein M422DRAFT_254320, partial [Sphaerobolus stellatus SS14]
MSNITSTEKQSVVCLFSNSRDPDHRHNIPQKGAGPTSEEGPALPNGKNASAVAAPVGPDVAVPAAPVPTATATANGGFYEPSHWNFPPFVPNKRPYSYSVHLEGVKYLEARLNGYNKIEGPQGHWPDFDYHTLLPPNASQAQLKTAQNRVLTKIDNMLSPQCPQQSGTDVITTVFRSVRRVSPKDVWAREDPEYVELESQEIAARDWAKVHRKKLFSLRMKLRSELFKKLPDEQQSHWKARSKECKNMTPSPVLAALEEMLRALPKLLALVGDTVSKKLGMYMEIRAAGAGPGDIPHYFLEKYNPIFEGQVIDYSTFEDSSAYDERFIGRIAGALKVDMKDMVVVPCWKPRVVEVDLKRPTFELRTLVCFDAEGNITSDEMDVRVSLMSYMDYTYAMVPSAQSGRRKKPRKPDWNTIAQADDVSNWIDPARLPPPPFELSSPMQLKKGRLFELAKHIWRGEMGLIDGPQQFKWKGQMEGGLGHHRVRPSKTQTEGGKAKVKGEGEGEGEEIDLGSSSDSDSDDEDEGKGEMEEQVKVATDEETKPTQKRKKTSAKDIDQAKPSKPPHQMKPRAAPKPKPALQAAAKSKVKVGKVSDPDFPMENGGEVIVSSSRTGSRGGHGKAAANKPDEDTDGEDGPVIVKRRLHHPFKGNFTQWYHDFRQHEVTLDWEVRPMGMMGADLLKLAQFLQATEVDTLISLESHIDVTTPLETNESDAEAVGNLWDILMQPSEPLPVPSSCRGIKRWLSGDASRFPPGTFPSGTIPHVKHPLEAILRGIHPQHIRRLLWPESGRFVYDAILGRAQDLIDAIQQHETESDNAHLQIGGPLGVIPTLRALEFMRRYIALRDPDTPYGDRLEDMFKQLEIVLAQEQFRRWATSSFHVGRNNDNDLPFKGISELYSVWAVWMEGVMRGATTPEEASTIDMLLCTERAFEPTDLLVCHSSENWQWKEVAQDMEQWIGNIDKKSFMDGSIIEKFLWTYAVYMTAGAGRKLHMPWWKTAVGNTIEWLRAATISLEPHLLDLRKDVFPTRTTQSTTTSKVTNTDNDMEAKKIGSKAKGNGMVSAAAIERVMGKATNRDSKEREDDYITPSDDVEEVIKTVRRRRAVEEPQPQPTEP